MGVVERRDLRSASRSIQGDRRVTWREFDDRAARLAAAFTAAGLKPGSKVASYLYNCNEYIEGVYATFKMRGVPVNVNYRYLEDELVYLLDNSDAEALLFHGALGDRVAKVRDRAPKREALDPGRRRLAARRSSRSSTRSCSPRTSRCRASSARGDDLYFLYTGGTTGMPKGVMWRNEDLCRACSPTARTRSSGGRCPTTPAEVGARRASRSSTPARPRAPARVAADARHRRVHDRSRRCSLGGAIVTLVGRHFDPHELWQTVQRERVTQMAIVGDAFAKPMLRALEEAEADGRAVRPLVARS